MSHHNDILAALRVFIEPGVTVEVRAPKCNGKSTASGYFNDLDAAAKAALALDGKAPGVYFTLNPVKSDLLARASNRIEYGAPNTTADADVLARHWLPLDFDPQRPAGISATDAEHAAAIERMQAVTDFLSGMGWPEPVKGDSGNGGHAAYRVDLPNDAASASLVQRLLKALAQFSDDKPDKPLRVCLDTTVHNAARIWKAYGTLVRKGDSTPDRPHRRAALLSVPSELHVVTREQIEQLCADLEDDKPEAVPRAIRSVTSSTSPLHIADFGAYLDAHNIGYRESAKNGARHFAIDECPWQRHADHSMWAMQFPNGNIAVGCSHNSCQGKRLADFRDVVEPGWRATASDAPLGKTTSSSVPTGNISDIRDRSVPLVDADGRNHADADEDSTEGEEDVTRLTRRGEGGTFPILSLDDLQKAGHIRPEELLAGKIMKRSLDLTYGDGDTGKSYFAQNACFELAAAGIPLWYVAAEGFDGVYLRILAWLARHPGKSLDALRVIPLPVQIFKGTDRHIIAAQARDQAEDLRPQLIVLDTLHRCTVGARENDNSDMVCVANTAALWRSEFGATTWAIHHEGKSAGNGLRGASCLYDDADSVQYVFRGGDISVIQCEKQKDGVPRFAPEAFTLDICALDAQGYPDLSAKVLRSLDDSHIIEARRMWTAEQQRRQPGAKNAIGGEDSKPLSETLAKGYEALTTLYEKHPNGVFKSAWRTACEAKGIKAGTFDWMTKELARHGKVTSKDKGYIPVEKEAA